MENLEKQIGWLLQEKYDGKLTASAKRDIARLKAGEPPDHVIGFVDFLGCKILVGPDVLIPRVETEFWTEKAIDELSGIGFQLSGPKVLDMFSGSGAIGIAVLKYVPKARVTFADSEKRCVRQIKKNLKAINYKLKAEVVQSDLFEKVKGQFDYIFANPPYIPTVRKNKIQKSVINYEPHAALFGGGDGMKFIKRFLAATKNRLNENGKIFMEFDSPQKLAIASLLAGRGYRKWDFHKDQYGKWRWVVVQ